MHQTKNLDDGYMGSGKLLKRAIDKHGLDNFVKEILHVFDNEQDMKDKEKELVVISEQTYNLCEGGKGGFGYINKILSPEQIFKRASAGGKSHLGKKRGSYSKERRMNISLGLIGRKPSMLGKHHTEETKEKMRQSYNPLSNPIGRKRGSYKKKITL